MFSGFVGDWYKDVSSLGIVRNKDVSLLGRVIFSPILCSFRTTYGKWRGGVEVV